MKMIEMRYWNKKRALMKIKKLWKQKTNLNYKAINNLNNKKNLMNQKNLKNLKWMIKAKNYKKVTISREFSINKLII
jgi:hypothetical protein